MTNFTPSAPMPVGVAGAVGVTGDVDLVDVEVAVTGKPTPGDLGIDLTRLTWERSGEGEGSIEVAFPISRHWPRGDWVLMRVAGDPANRILVFDRNEWECFIDGVRNGEFDDAASIG